ncbi:TenA family protein, partial [Cutibacterium sp.]
MNAFTPSLPAPLTTAGIAVAPSGRVAALSAGRSEAWTAAINHRFVNELFSGELDDAQLSYYIIQDNQFFVPFLELLGEALVRADTVEAKLVFGRQLGMICSEESGWFEATFDELGVSQADRAHPHLSEPTRSFENLMHKAVNTHHYPTVLVLLVVAEGLYLDWASRTDA